MIIIFSAVFLHLYFLSIWKHCFTYTISTGRWEITQSAQLGESYTFPRICRDLHRFLDDETVWATHSSYSPDSAHITTDSSRGGNK